MALYAFDGTWNEDEDAPVEDTNVVRFRDLYGGPVEYRQGVGTRFGRLGRLVGGLFGAGGRSRVEEMYDALRKNWQHGDRTIDIIGFSRGAALAVHFANIVGEKGIRLNDDQVEKPPIRFVGVWDIVGSFGIPINLIIDFQQINLNWTIDRVPDTVERCCHAMALDERRRTFRVTRLERAPNVDEFWFRGVHSDVGGGNRNVGRSNIALGWMLQRARSAGLPVTEQDVKVVLAESDPMAPISENKDPIRDRRREVFDDDIQHPTARARQLRVGESFDFPVRAAYKYNWSGVRLQRGATYGFEVEGDQRWRDGSISCDAAGWDTKDLPWYKEALVRHFEDDRRVEDANWFELIGSLGDEGDDFFRIGRGGPGVTYSPERDDDLFAFANDLKSRYKNNKGEIRLTVRRIA